jgi:hypothetical protein
MRRQAKCWDAVKRYRIVREVVRYRTASLSGLEAIEDVNIQIGDVGRVACY